MNRPVELLLADMGRRSGIQDIDQFAQVFAAAKRSGGELTDIISQTAGIIRDKIQVQEEIHTMTAARVFEQKIMNGIPFGIILYIDLTSPGFFQTMYHTWLGRICMTVCLGVYVGAVYLAKRILDIQIYLKKKESGKRALSWVSFKGSLTLEAALCFPLMVFFCVTLSCLWC